ncbi:MAG: hypothetical protein QOE70_2167 [Chthoniobacter sp.]|jgi:hypothetical protein|nr:hypothetical protein [Chthoniobacter sp.]
MVLSRLSLLLVCVLAAWAGWTVSRPGTAEAKPVTVAAPARSDPTSAPAAIPAAAADELGDRLKKALALAYNGGTPAARDAALVEIEESLPASERATAVATLARLGGGQRDAAHLAGYWMEQDLPSARAWFLGLSPEAQAQFAPAVLETWARLDAADALAWLEKLPEAQRTALPQDAREVVARNLGVFDPARVLALLSPGHREGLSPGAMRSTTTSDGAILRGERTGVSMLFEALARRTPAEAAAQVNAMPGGAVRTEAAVALATVWAERDPVAVRAWAERLNDGVLAAEVFPALALGWAVSDAHAAVEWMAAQPATRVNTHTMSGLISTWAGRDAAAALAWIDGQPAGSGAAEVAPAVLRVMTEAAPEKMAAVILQRMHDGRAVGEFHGAQLSWEIVRAQGLEAALRTAEQFAEEDTDGAGLLLYGQMVNGAAQVAGPAVAVWVLRQPPGPRRRLALDQAALGFRDRAAALKWGLDLPREADSDPARVTLALKHFIDEPDTAMQLLAGVTDADSEPNWNLRWNSILGWLRRDPKTARLWLDHTETLNSAQRAEVLELLRKYP